MKSWLRIKTGKCKSDSLPAPRPKVCRGVPANIGAQPLSSTGTLDHFNNLLYSERDHREISLTSKAPTNAKATPNPKPCHQPQRNLSKPVISSYRLVIVPDTKKWFLAHIHIQAATIINNKCKQNSSIVVLSSNSFGRKKKHK
jgi:hypothetical protein